MTNEISLFGDLGISGSFGWTDNRIVRKFYLNNPGLHLFGFLQKMFGTAASPYPHQFNTPFNSFYASDCSFQMVDQHGAWGSTDIPNDFSLCDEFPDIKGGITIDVTYVPMDNSDSVYPITDEEWDFSGNVMSLIGNQPNQKPETALCWQTSGLACSNTLSVNKIIPKIEVRQKKWYVTSLPDDDGTDQLEGSINNAPFMGGKNNSSGGNSLWAEGTVLCVGFPVIRRWRFDGTPIFEVGVKLAVNTYRDTIETGSVDYVGWNRLYNIQKQQWQTVEIGKGTGIKLYPEVDFSALSG